MIRHATQDDIPALLEIHNEVIREGNIALDDAQRTLEQQKRWFCEHAFPYGIWLIERNKKILGWASLNRFTPAHVHRFNATMSIYLTKTARGQGLGKALTRHILHNAKKRNFHKIILMVCEGNTPAVALYTTTGFRSVGVYKDHRFADGVWKDTIIMEQII